MSASESLHTLSLCRVESIEETSQGSSLTLWYLSFSILESSSSKIRFYYNLCPFSTSEPFRWLRGASFITSLYYVTLWSTKQEESHQLSQARYIPVYIVQYNVVHFESNNHIFSAHIFLTGVLSVSNSHLLY